MKQSEQKTSRGFIRKRIVPALALLVCTACAIGTVPVEPVAAATVTDSKVKNYENQIAAYEAQLKSLKNTISSTASEVEKYETEKQRIDKEIELLGSKIEATQGLIEALNGDITTKEQEIASKEQEYEEKYEQFKTRMRVTYEEGQVSYLEMLFDADSLADFLSRVDRIGSMLDYDTKVMDTLESERIALEEAKTGLETSRSETQVLLAQLKQDEDDLEAAAEEAASYLKKLQSNQAVYQAMYASNQKKMEEADAALEKYLKELEEKQKQQNAKYVGGEYMWPVPTTYTRVSSGYGWRDSPISGQQEFHNGIDIPAAYGTDIYAANAGTVITATYHWSYGNYVMVDHGGGKVTLYAHCSKLLVKVGDKVTKGQVIARVGSTGSSTGNHLHFSTYSGGAHYNPMQHFS
ncbi:MAG: peptidoglycan DD-metalloendopeptidase family protein [Clostridia bacterium]|nr:peptidoglycan DD-metalloendopeptidase family protein [Clostridia bacterium]